MSIMHDIIFYYLVASGVASALVLVLCGVGWACRRWVHHRHVQPVYGPFRPNLRKIV